MLFRLQDRLLCGLYPIRRAAWPLLGLGTLSFPAMVGLAVVLPEMDADYLFIGWVTGLALVLLGILTSMSRPEALPKKGVRNHLARLWETLVFWLWLVCLAVFASLAIKILTFTGA